MAEFLYHAVFDNDELAALYDDDEEIGDERFDFPDVNAVCGAVIPRVPDDSDTELQRLLPRACPARRCNPRRRGLLELRDDSVPTARTGLITAHATS